VVTEMNYWASVCKFRALLPRSFLQLPRTYKVKTDHIRGKSQKGRHAFALVEMEERRIGLGSTD